MLDYGRAQYEAEVRERDRLMADVKRRGLLDQYIRLEVENEGWDGEPSLQAAAMRRILARKPEGQGFAARFSGTCGNCRGKIVPGQYIRRWLPREGAPNEKTYAHTECPQ